MSNWNECRIGRLVTLQQGLCINSKSNHLLANEGYILLRITDLINKTESQYIHKDKVAEKFVLTKRDLIYTRTGQVGLIFKGYEGVIHNNCFKVIPNNEIDAYYLHWYLRSKTAYDYANSVAAGSAQPDLGHSQFKSMPIRYPNKTTQRKIAAVLSAYDDLIENCDRRITLLEKMAEEIYREWFVRLRFPGHEQTTFHKGIPEGWEVKRFDEFCLLQRGFDLPNDKVQVGLYPVLASTSIKTFHNQFKVKPPVITTGRSGSLGTVLLVNEPAWPLNTTLFVKKIFGNSHYLIYYTLKFLKLENFNSGAGVPTLNRNHLGGLKLSVPPKELQTSFDQKLSCIFRQQENLEKTREVLKQTRDRLLTRLISGKLFVEDLDIQFPPSMIEDLPHEQ